MIFIMKSKMYKKLHIAALIFVLPFVLALSIKIPDGVNFVGIKNGDTVKSPLKVKMEVHGKTVAPAGDMTPNTGHFHILINQDIVEKGKVIIADENHIHYGKGQTEAELVLKPGRTKLTVLFADGLHQSFGPEWSQTVEVDVLAE
jgi:Domain of unknown function (DUF4399)